MAIKGLHHIHLTVSDLAAGVAFAQDFGLVEAAAVGQERYMRGLGCHSYLVVLEEGRGLEFSRLAFEVDDDADLGRAINEHGASARHPLGSHVFDVWKDPDGFRYETFSDTDLLNASTQTGLHAIQDMEMDLWSDRDVEFNFA